MLKIASDFPGLYSHNGRLSRYVRLVSLYGSSRSVYMSLRKLFKISLRERFVSLYLLLLLRLVSLC